MQARLTWDRDVDYAASKQLEAQALEVMSGGDVDVLVLDLRDAGFVDAAGIGVVVEVGNLVLAHGAKLHVLLCPQGRRLFRLAGVPAERSTHDVTVPALDASSAVDRAVGLLNDQ